MPYPTREEMREFATEEAKHRVSALLQAFALPFVDEDAIHKLLVDALTNMFVAGFAGGWDASLDVSADVVKAIKRFHLRKDA